MKKTALIFALVTVLATVAMAEEKEKVRRFDRSTEHVVFIPKGQFSTGAAFSYTEQTNEDFKFLVLDGINAEAYSFKVSPMVSYFFKDNFSAGGRVAYSRGYTDLGNISIALADLGFSMADFKQTTHTISVDGFVRMYMPLLGSKRLGLFNEVRLTYGYGQSKTENGLAENTIGTHEITHSLNFGFAPGVVVFMEDFIAIEVAIDVLGLNFKWIEQNTNQVETGSRTKSGANFKLNLLSISMGIIFYI